MEFKFEKNIDKNMVVGGDFQVNKDWMYVNIPIQNFVGESKNGYLVYIPEVGLIWLSKKQVSLEYFNNKSIKSYIQISINKNWEYKIDTQTDKGLRSMLGSNIIIALKRVFEIYNLDYKTLNFSKN